MKTKLRLGVLLDGDEIPAWSYAMLETIQSSEYAEIILCVKKFKAKKPKAYMIAKVWRNRAFLLWILYSRIDSILFKSTPNAFEPKDSKALLSCDELIVKARETKFSDYFQDEDINLIEGYQVDILLCLGFRILRGKILSTPKFGVWSFHHGDNSLNRGGPAGTWEVLKGWDNTGVVLQILTENLDAGKIISRSLSATDNLSIHRNKNNYYWKALSLVPRALEKLQRLGADAFFNELELKNAHPCFYSNQLFSKPKNFEVFKGVLGIYTRKLKSLVANKFFFNQWILLYGQKTNESDVNPSFFRFIRILPPKDRFWADPFLIQYKEENFVFFEELIYKENRGKIACFKLSEDGSITDKQTAIERPYHLSYPFLFEDGGEIYMIPESAANKSIELYKCIEFPGKWELEKVLMSDIQAFDTTIHFQDGVYWMFCNLLENKGASTHDELFIFFSKDLKSDKWKAHPENPVVSNVNNARPAGRLFMHKGELFRPSQNCGKRYGYGMIINKITTLNFNFYKEEFIQAIEPSWADDLLGTHTFNQSTGLFIIDALIRRSRYL